MGTTVTYNGITLDNCLTREWMQEFAWDDTRQEMIAVRLRATWQCTLHGQTAQTGIKVGSAGYPTTGPADNWSNLVASLREPRRALVVSLNGATVYSCNPSNGAADDSDRDIRNGPIPLNARVTAFVGNQTATVLFSIECNKLECGGALGVLSHHFGVTESMDADFYTTRQITGTIVLSGALGDPIQAKGLVVPWLEDTFRRESVSFVVAADNLSAQYTVVDRQVHTAAPYPSTTISGTHSESLVDQSKTIVNVSVRLTAPPSVPVAALVASVVAILRVRAGLGQYSSSDPKRFLNEATIATVLGDKNIVEGRISVTRNIVFSEGNALKISRRLMEPLNGDITPAGTNYTRNLSPIPSVNGYAFGADTQDSSGTVKVTGTVRTALNLAQLLQFNQPKGSVCTPISTSSGGGSPPKTTTGQKATQKEPGTETTVGETTTIPQVEFGLYSQDDSDTLYTIYRLESKYVLRQMKVQLPVATDEENEDTCVIVRLGRPQSFRVITVDAERIGAWPELLAPLDGYEDENGVSASLMDHRVAASAPVISNDGQQLVYHSRGSYLYALSRPLKAGENMPIGTIPFTSLSQQDGSMPSGEVYTLSPLGG